MSGGKDHQQKSREEKSREPQIAHAEAALGAGRSYENANEGHNEMFNSLDKLQEHRMETQNNKSNHESRGARIDRELQASDEAIIKEKNAHALAKEDDK